MKANQDPEQTRISPAFFWNNILPWTWVMFSLKVHNGGHGGSFFLFY